MLIKEEKMGKEDDKNGNGEVYQGLTVEDMARNQLENQGYRTVAALRQVKGIILFALEVGDILTFRFFSKVYKKLGGNPDDLPNEPTQSE
jgi:hypothetical protein